MKRQAYTLLELMLALALIVVAAGLIGSIMQLYSTSFATRGEDLRRKQLARAVLNMVAEDIRAVVTAQKYDGSVLQQQLGGQGAGGGGGGQQGAQSQGAGQGTQSQTQAGQTQSGQTQGAQAGQTGTQTGSNSSSSTGTGDTGTMMSTPTELGLYGSQYQLMLDISRLPRAHELQIQGSITSPTLSDAPGDIKSVTYFVQAPSNTGVQDSMDVFLDTSEATTGLAGGLIRRQIDRAVLMYAEESGNLTQLMRTGDLIAPEVLAIEFSYFDGIEWSFTWDSATQSLPWLIQITIAVQSAKGESAGKMDAGIMLSTITDEQMTEFGIEIHDIVVAIPGAQLRAADPESQNISEGMQSMGVN